MANAEVQYRFIPSRKGGRLLCARMHGFQFREIPDSYRPSAFMIINDGGEDRILGLRRLEICAFSVMLRLYMPMEPFSSCPEYSFSCTLSMSWLVIKVLLATIT